MPLALLIALAYAFRGQLSFVDQAFRELRSFPVDFLASASFFALLSIIAMGKVMQLLMRAGKIRVSLAQATALTLASNAWSTTLPAGPAFSAALTFQVQRRWGARAIVCGWFMIISAVISTMWLTLIGIFSVFVGSSLTMGPLIATLVLIIVILSFIFWICNHPSLLERGAHAALSPVNRLLHRTHDAGMEFVATQVRTLAAIRLTFFSFVRVSLFSLLNRLLDIAVLWVAILGVTQGLFTGVSLTGMLLAYVAAKIAGSAQITPAGLGTVEAALIATLVVNGMDAVTATSAAIIYRAISFLLVTIIGWVIYLLNYSREGFSGPAGAPTQPARPA